MYAPNESRAIKSPKRSQSGAFCVCNMTFVLIYLFLEIENKARKAIYAVFAPPRIEIGTGIF